MPKICSKCGREGDPNNLFCGMCGRPLFEVQDVRGAAPTTGPRTTQSTAAAIAAREAPQANGLSILGLSGSPDPSPSTAYLLEDDASSSHWGRRAVLFAVLLVVVAVAGWHWRAQLKSLEARYVQQAPPVQSGTTTYSAQSVATEGSEVAGTNPNAQVMTPTQTQSPNVAAETTTSSQAMGPAATPTQAQANADTPTQPYVGKNSAPTPTALDVPAEGRPADKAAKQEKSAPVVDSNAMAYEAEGEKYLYGTGVPQNCSSALQGLTLAAERTNAKAEGVLGTMYATGHCVSPSRPMAYHWFAKALQQDPANLRIERQMQVLWGQMTPDERRIAGARD